MFEENFLLLRIILPVLGDTYRSAREPIRRLLATGRSTRYSLVSDNTGLFRVVTVNFNRDCPLPSDISLAAMREEVWRRRGRSKKRENRENLDAKPFLGLDSTLPSLDDPDLGGISEVTARATEEVVSFIALPATLPLLRRVLR
ncbi:hypothetical protein BHE74_00050734 [Ensete ventricosum]|nr:hypothetical protein BHE74_00050734 [Ensete ventricosum]